MTINQYKNTILGFILSLIFCSSHGQMQYLNNDDNALHFVDRFQHLYNADSIRHTSFRNIRRHDVKRILNQSHNDSISIKDDIVRSHIDNTLYFSEDIFVKEQKGLWNTFYKNKAHFFEVNTPDFKLTINPILNVQFGRDSKSGNSIFLNMRGFELWGDVDQKLYFYSSFFEHQSNFFNYIDPFIEKYKSIPGQGNYKPFTGSLFPSENSFDYANTQAYLGYKITKHSHLELGHGRFFIGNGMRSLLLSDFANNYFYLKFGFRIWKIQYQTIFAELNNGSSRSTVGDMLLPKKYKATHYLSFKPSPKFEIGIFETVVFAREDHFEFQYLNPVILYRTVEFSLDSPDNVLIGFNANWQALPKTSFYGQLILDEFRTSELFSGNGWWGNKIGYQVGVKHFDLFGIKTLDFQTEFNRVRPYTYSHNKTSEFFPDLSVSSYSHNNQALAHPLGANFSEVIVKLRYQPFQKFVLNARYIYSIVGRDNNSNTGGDILITNTSRESNFNNQLHQGAKSKISHIDLSLSYELYQNLYLDGFVKIRSDENITLEDINTSYFGTGIRYNISNRQIDY